jgi:hypothetical protein
MSYKSHQTPLEHKRLLQIAREYRQQGYDVTLYPEATDLPAELASCPFDLIAQNGSQHVAVEVRSREHLTLNGPEDLRRMSDLVNQVPNWELELVVTNPRNKASVPGQKAS